MDPSPQQFTIHRVTSDAITHTDTPDGKVCPACGAATMAGAPGRSHCVRPSCHALMVTEVRHGG